ncbi:hypothetical protein [Streptomyces nigrescens]
MNGFVARARRAERAISPEVRAAARISRAELVGLDQRLKSPDSLKRKVATWMPESPGQTVDASLRKINDAVRFTLQWPAGTHQPAPAACRVVALSRANSRPALTPAFRALFARVGRAAAPEHERGRPRTSRPGPARCVMPSGRPCSAR